MKSIDISDESHKWLCILADIRRESVARCLKHLIYSETAKMGKAAAVLDGGGRSDKLLAEVRAIKDILLSHT